MALNDNFVLANQRAKELHAVLPKAVAARYDRKSARIVVDLNSRLSVSFSPRDAQGLERAKPAQLDEIEVSPSGFGIYFPKLDADIYVPGLLDGFLGSRKWMAARMGAVGGKSRSRAKRTASRLNGKMGGRPRKQARG